MNIGVLPPGVGFQHIYGAGLLAGVGFITMGLFVTALAFDVAALAASARLAIFVGSTLSALVGLAVLHFAQGEPETRMSRR